MAARCRRPTGCPRHALPTNVLRVTQHEPKLQIAPPFAAPPSRSSISVQRMRLFPPARPHPPPPVAVLPLRVLRSAINVPLVEDRTAGTFGARVAA